MNQLFADKGAHIGVIKKVVDGVFDILHTGLSIRDNLAIEQKFLSWFMIVVKHDHGHVKNPLTITEKGCPPTLPFTVA